MPSSPKKKAATLSRVRDNQRRCRARKREYVSELEQKIRDLQVTSVPGKALQLDGEVKMLKSENLRLQQVISQLEQQTQDQQAAAMVAVVESHEIMKRLTTEIRELRETLSRIRLHDIRGVAGHRESGGNADAVADLSGETLVPVNRKEVLLTPEPFLPSFPTNFDDLTGGASTLGPPVDLFEMFDFSGGNLLDVASAKDHHVDEASDCCCSKADPGSAHLQPPDTSSQCSFSGMASSSSTGDTTLCSVAYELVRQNNRRGVDMIEIGIRLWNGFQKGEKEGEGCKVENKLLYTVLDYLSG